MKKNLLLLLTIVLLTGCRTVSNQEQSTTYHRLETMMERMDSVIHSRQQVQQDSVWHETVIRQLEHIKERNDTSRVVVVDSAGRVVKETVTIIRERDATSENDRLEREGLIHRLEKADSTLVVMQSKLAYSDSLLQASTKVKTIEEKTPWYKQLFSTLKNILLGVIIGMVLLVMLIAATKKHWTKLINTK
jgi:hypothetical protein